MKIFCPKCAKPIKDQREPIKCKCGAKFARPKALISLASALLLAKAIDHKIRLRIMLAFSHDTELSASDIAERIDSDLSTVCYHVGVLGDAEPPFLLPVRTKIGGRGTAQVFYRVNGALLGD